MNNTLYAQIKDIKCGYGKTYFTKEECVQDRLNGLEIVEFAEEPFEINIEVLPNRKVTHILRFIED